MARAETKPVRLSKGLVDSLEKAAEAQGRSVPAEAELRLQASLARGAWNEVELRLEPQARALGLFVAFLANELLKFSPPGSHAHYLKAGVARAAERLETAADKSRGTKLKDPADEAEIMADYWFLRLWNAAQPTRDSASPEEAAEIRALADIRKILIPEAETPAKESK